MDTMTTAQRGLAMPPIDDIPSTSNYIYRVVNGANGNVIAIYPGDLQGAIRASVVAQATNAIADDPIGWQHYSERHEL